MPSDIWTSRELLIRQGAWAVVRDSTFRTAPDPAPAAEVAGERRPLPAEVLTARVRAVMQARAATRRGHMARLLGCGCMKTLPLHTAAAGLRLHPLDHPASPDAR